MGATFGRLKVWAAGDILTAADLNGEFNNLLTNLTPAGVDDYQVSAAEARTQTDPGSYASPSLAVSLAGDIEHLRKRIADVIGGSNASWLDAPTTSLGVLSQPSGGLYIGLEFDGINGGASSTTDVLSRFINLGGIINALSLSAADVAAADFDATNKKFGSHAYSLGAGNILAFPGNSGNPLKGTLSAWFRNLSAGDYIAYNPLLGIELYCDAGAGKLTAKVTKKTAATESTKNAATVQGSATRSADTTFRNAIMRWRCNDEAGASTDLLQLAYGGADEGSQLTSQDIDIDGGDGGVWFFGAKRNDPAWDHFYAANGAPTAHSDAWTSNGTPNATVSAGILNIATSGANAGSFSKTNNIDLSQFTCEFKMRINSQDAPTGISPSSCVVSFRDDSMDRSLDLRFMRGYLAITTGSSNLNQAHIALSTTEWHTYRITFSGSPSPTVNLYIDGVLRVTLTNSATDLTAGDRILFGDNTAVASQNSNTDWEYFKYFDAGATPPVAVGSTGQLDSIGVASNVVDAAVVTSLQSSAVSSVFNAQPAYGVSLPPTALFNRDFTLQSTSTTFEDVGAYVYYIPGDGKTEIELEFSGSFITTGLGNSVLIGIDMNNDLTGQSSHTFFGGGRSTLNTSGDRATTTARLSVIPPVGLNEFRPQWMTSAGTIDIPGEESVLWICRRRIRS